MDPSRTRDARALIRLLIGPPAPILLAVLRLRPADRWNLDDLNDLLAQIDHKQHQHEGTHHGY